MRRDLLLGERLSLEAEGTRAEAGGEVAEAHPPVRASSAALPEFTSQQNFDVDFLCNLWYTLIKFVCVLDIEDICKEYQRWIKAFQKDNSRST